MKGRSKLTLDAPADKLGDYNVNLSFRIAGKPAFQIDLSSLQLFLFGTTFFATDTLLLAVFGVSLVLFIALFTALLGRVWCGWACPQTIYMELVFRVLEGVFEGPPHWRQRDEARGLAPGRLPR
ncbi:MAG: 4Fe-4S binding protein, partial [Planctomycetaceae bacterium]